MNITDELAKARAELASAQERLAKIEAEANKPKEVVPWEPEGGDCFLSRYGIVDFSDGELRSKLAGSEYPTEAAARSALPYVTFFKRMCCLAQELNPSGKVGGRWWPRKTNGGWRASEADQSAIDIVCVFETEEAAKQACAIMDRDSWEVPAI